MSIEEAEFILNNAVIEQPSISSYTYISTEEINIAIERLLEELILKRQEVELLQKELSEITEKYEEKIYKRETDKPSRKKEDYLGILLNNRDVFLSPI